ncbi:MAG: ribosome maturation factor RimM [Candidatus Dormibacteria bacterium]
MTARSPEAPSALRAALVRRPHGLLGEVSVEVLGGDPTRFRPGTRLLVEDDGAELTVRSARPGSDGGTLLRFTGIDTPQQAASLRGAYLCVDATAARALGPDEWFVWQLVGMRCVTAEGAPLGEVVDVEAAPAADVLVVDDGTAQRLFPMVRAFVRSVDTATGVITLTPLDEDTA